MLKFERDGPAATPTPAATLLVVRTAAEVGIELFCVRRHGKSAFLGGAVVFPGGKLDGDDGDLDWTGLSNGIHTRTRHFSEHAAPLALAICACRESLEEAALLPVCAPLDDSVIRELQQAAAQGASLHALLRQRDIVLDTASLRPFARWITPEAEQRRFDAYFFITEAVAGQRGYHDRRETTSGSWAAPQQLIEAFLAGKVFLAPPTLRALELLAAVDSVEAAMALADAQSLQAICPKVISFDPLTLVLPGDSQHPITEPRVAGPSRFVMDEGRLLSFQPERALRNSLTSPKG